MAAPSRSRRGLKIAAIGLILLVVLIALIPSMITLGLGHGIVRAALAERINGTVDFNGLSVRWRGPQVISGLVITDERGRRVTDIDVSLRAGLVALIFNTTPTWDVEVTGMVTANVAEDGSINVMNLVRTDETAEGGLDRPLLLSLRTMRGQINDFSRPTPIYIDPLEGDIAFIPGGRSTVDITGRTRVASMGALARVGQPNDMVGRITIKGETDRLTDAAGAFTPAGATLSINVEAESIPVLGMDVESEIQRLIVTATSENIAEQILLTFSTDAIVAEDDGRIGTRSEVPEPSHLNGTLAIRSLFADDGSFDFGLDKLAGSVTGTRVPSALAQPMFTDTPVVLRRDAGRTIDLDLAFTAGEETVETNLFVNGPRAMLDVAATYTLETGEWRGDRLLLSSFGAHPDLVEGYTTIRPDQPIDVEIVLNSFLLPAVDPAKGARPLSKYQASGTVRSDGPARVKMPLPDEYEETWMEYSSLHIALDSAELGRSVHLSGEASVEGGRLDFDCAVTNLFDGANELALDRAMIEGTLTLTDLPVDLVAGLMPEYETPLRSLYGDALGLDIQTRAEAGAMVADFNTQGRAISAQVSAAQIDGGFDVRRAQSTLTLSPALVAWAQQTFEFDMPLTLRDEANVEVSVDPFTITGAAPGEYELTWPLSGRLAIDSLVVDDVPGLAEAARAREFNSTFTAAMASDLRIELAGSTALERAEARRPVGRAAWDLALSRPAGQDAPWRTSGTASLEQMRVADAEALLGQTPETIRQWTGDSGGLSAEIDMQGESIQAALRGSFDRLQVQTDAVIDEHAIALSQTAGAITLTAEMVESWINRRPDQVGFAGRLRVGDRVSAHLDAPSLHIPRALLAGETFDPADVRGRMNVTADRLRLIHPDGARTTFQEMAGTIHTSGLQNGVEVEGSARTAERDGGVTLTGRVRNLIAGGAISMDGATIDLDGNATHVPSLLVDALLGLDGYFAAAVGPEMSATINASDFSRTSGVLAMDVTAVNGSLRARGRGEDNRLVFTGEDSIAAQLELTQLLRERLLFRLHPLLGDVVHADQPLRATLTNAALPLDGDVARLDAQVALSLGRVEFDRRSPLFAPLALVRQDGVPRLDGEVPDIRAEVNSGVVTYDRFNVRVAQINMPFEGAINLTGGETTWQNQHIGPHGVYLRTKLPLASLATGFLPREIPIAQLGPIIQTMDLPIVYFGPIDRIESRIDPDFDIGKMLREAGILPDPTDPLRGIGDLLDGLRRRDR